MMRVHQIIDIVSGITGYSPAEIKGKKRTRNFVRPRYLVSYFARKEGHSRPHIGRCMGGKDHSTILNHCRKAEDWSGKDPILDEYFAATEAAIANRYFAPVIPTFVKIEAKKPVIPKLTPNERAIARVDAAVRAAYDEVMYA